jgi:hypothetical protein
MILAAPDSAAASKRTVDRPRRPNLQARDSQRQRSLVVGLDDRVHVIGLDRELYDAKPLVLRGRDRSSERGKRSRLPEGWDDRHGSKGDVHGMAWLVLGASDVGHDRAAIRFRRPSGAATGPAPSLRRRELELTRPASRLEFGHKCFSASPRTGCDARADFRGNLNSATNSETGRLVRPAADYFARGRRHCVPAPD